MLLDHLAQWPAPLCRQKDRQPARIASVRIEDDEGAAHGISPRMRFMDASTIGAAHACAFDAGQSCRKTAASPLPARAEGSQRCGAAVSCASRFWTAGF